MPVVNMNSKTIKMAGTLSRLMNNQNGGSNKSAERSGLTTSLCMCAQHTQSLRKMSKVKIWHSEEKKFFDVYCLNTISEYNESMGDVD